MVRSPLDRGALRSRIGYTPTSVGYCCVLLLQHMVGGWIAWWVCPYGFVGEGVGGCVGWYVVDCVLA